MYVDVLYRVHIRLSDFFDKGGGEPDGDLEFGNLETVDNDSGVQSVVQSLNGGSPPEIEAVKKMPKAVRP